MMTTFSTEPGFTMMPPIPLTLKKNPNLGSFRVPEPLVSDQRCPHCGAENLTERDHRVWRVADERGMHRECDVCACSWWPDGRVLKPR